MKIYFKENINNNSIIHSLEQFDDKETLISSNFKYYEFNITDDYSDEQAQALCECIIYNYVNKGIPLEETLQIELVKQENFVNSLKDFSEFKTNDCKISEICVLVSLVYRGNFNDERLIDTLNLKIEKLDNQKLFWFDLYLGKFLGNKTKIAPVFIDKSTLYLLINNDGKVDVTKKTGFSKIYSADYDEKYIISTEIYCK